MKMQDRAGFTHTFSDEDAYSSWSHLYDRDVARMNYRAPGIVADLASQESVSGLAMDLGCGTGLVVEEYRRRSKSKVDFDGCDRSDEMLQIAKAKGLYRQLILGVLSDDLVATRRYALITACGLFATSSDRNSTGDPDASCLGVVFRLLEGRGIFVLSLSDRVWSSDRLAYLAQFGRYSWSLVTHEQGDYHDMLPSAHYFVLKRDD
jgi:predicted TPR repeat methyltransferase